MNAKVEEFYAKRGWPHDIHPETMEAIQHVDSAFFTGDPSETRPKYEYLKHMVDRWAKALESAKRMLEEREREENS